MKRIAILASVIVALAAAAVAAAAPTGHAARAGTVQLRRTSIGTILVNSRGMTIYAFGRDSRNRDRCASISGCTSVWPLVTSSGRPTAGSGVARGLLGSIRVAGHNQATYAGRPLYTYTGDGAPGDTSYVGASQFGGTWYAVTANGKLVR